MIIDTHCHYNLSPLYEDWQKHWQKAQEQGVKKTIIPSASIETSRRAIEIAKLDENLFAAIGIHPNEYDTTSLADLPTVLSQNAAALSMVMDENVIAIGETGLDYFRLKDDQRELAIQNQKMAFKMHIQLANEFEKTLIVHSRDKGGKKDKNNQAYWDILEIVKKDYQHNKPFILHCVSGPSEYIEEALKLGAYIGVGANITYPNADELREIIKLVPKDKLLIETDAPYLPPQEYRGQICEPWMIKKTAEYINQNYSINFPQLEQNFIGLL